MPVSKTRTKLVDVARCLFAKTSYDVTTMNDIAVASKVGRRTLYTYFKSKEEIYLAVVQSELDRLSQSMHEIAERDLSPDEKILALIQNHLASIKAAVYRNGTLRANFFRDIWRVEAVRKDFDTKQIQLIRSVLQEGKEKGIFNTENVHLISDILYYCIKGIEVPFIRGQIVDDNGRPAGWEYVSKIVFGALGKTTDGAHPITE